MSNMEPRLTSGIIRMRFTGDRTALLTGEAITIEYESTRFLGDSPFESRCGFCNFQQIFTRLQIGAVIMSQDQITLLSSQLTHTTRPLADAPSNFAQFVRLHDPT